MIGTITMICHWIQSVLVFSLIVIFEKLRSESALFPLYITARKMFPVSGFVHYYVFSWSIPLSIGFFFLLSACFQTFQVFFNKNNPLCNIYLRYVEYSITASLMIVSIGIQVGIRDVQILFLLCALISTMSLLGYIADGVDQLTFHDPFRWYPHFLSWMLCGNTFCILITSYVLNISENGSPPWFVHVILFSMLLLFSSFGVVQFHDFFYRCDRTKDIDRHYRQVGARYDFLSIFSKSLLAWLIIFPTFFTQL